MTPSLFGRLQTRIVILATLGVLWTVAITGLLPRPGPDVSLSSMYRVTFSALAVVLALGLVWELVYHGAQQYRWEKDWPTFFGLLTGVPEGIAAWFVLSRVVIPELDTAALLPFVLHFSTTWIVVWLFVNGPIRVVAPRWRFRGGRFL